jgi:hypothetical protein
MRQKSLPEKEPATQVVKNIRRATRRHFSEHLDVSMSCSEWRLTASFRNPRTHGRPHLHRSFGGLGEAGKHRSDVFFTEGRQNFAGG